MTYVRERQILYDIICVESKETELTETTEWWLPGAGRWEKWEDVGQRVHNSSYKVSKFEGSLMYNMVIIVNTVLPTWKLKK